MAIDTNPVRAGSSAIASGITRGNEEECFEAFEVAMSQVEESHCELFPGLCVFGHVPSIFFMPVLIHDNYHPEVRLHHHGVWQ